MKRGDLFLVSRPSNSDPRRQRAMVVVSRQFVVDSKFSTVVCAPIYSWHDGFSTQVLIGADEGMKHESSIHCDELLNLEKSKLSYFIGRLTEAKLRELDLALVTALDIDVAAL